MQLIESFKIISCIFYIVIVMKRKTGKLKFILPFITLAIVTFALSIAIAALNPEAPIGLYERLILAFTLSIAFAIITAYWFYSDLRHWKHSLRKEISGDISEKIKKTSGQEEFEYLAKVYEDMTEELKSQKDQTEKQKKLLEESRMRVEVILSSVPDGVVTINEDNIIYSWNAGAEAITHYNELNTVGSPYQKIMIFTDKKGTVIPLAENPIEECFRTKKVVDKGDIFLRTRLDIEVPVDIKAAPMFDTGGNVLGVAAAFRDVSKKREIEQMKEDFLAMVTHDLKSPLAAVVGYTNLMLHPKADFPKEQQHEFLNSILGSVKILQFLIDNILESARLESGRIIYQFDDFDIKALMCEIQIMFTPLVDSKKITLNVEGDSMWIYGDREKLREVINNLVSNAIKFTPSGGTISITYKKSKENAVITVSDTGKGIPHEEQGKLFKKFVQVKGEKRGTGLGLYIVKKLLEDHGQTISVESEPGKGTKFMFTLGYGTPKEDTADTSKKSASNFKVLIVEDTPEVSKLLKYYLTQSGYETLQAYTGKEALNLIEKEKPDLITLDYNLPDMNGREIIEKSGLRSKGKSIPVLLITANSPAEKDFYDKLLIKPVDEKQFIVEVSRLINKSTLDSVEVLK